MSAHPDARRFVCAPNRSAPGALAHRGVATCLVVLLLAATIAAAGAGSRAAAANPLQDAIDAYRAGAPLRALALFSRIARTQPMSALPAIWAGVAATAAGKTREAEAYFREGLRRPHSYFQERVTKGWLHKLSVLREAIPAMPGAPKAIAAIAHAANPRLTWEQASWIGEHVTAAARTAGLDPWLLASVVYIESRFNHAATSMAGATGLGQLMPDAARAARVDPSDPWQNLLGTAMTLRAYYREFGNWSVALAAYNAGATAVRRYGGIPPYAETRWYVNAVLSVYHQFRPNG